MPKLEITDIHWRSRNCLAELHFKLDGDRAYCIPQKRSLLKAGYVMVWPYDRWADRLGAVTVEPQPELGIEGSARAKPGLKSHLLADVLVELQDAVEEGSWLESEKFRHSQVHVGLTFKVPGLSNLAWNSVPAAHNREFLV